MAVLHCVITLLALAFAATAGAAWPERPLRYVLPSAAGGGPDIAARIVMAELSRQLGQQVVVENRPGASGRIGTEAIAKATPDGYTIGHGNILTLAIGRSVMKLPYDIDRDIAPVVQMYYTPNLMAVTLSLPVNSVQELIAHAKQHPDKLSYASTGSGSSIHVGMELFKLMTGTQMIHVPYKAIQTAITEVIAGRVQLTFDNLASMTPHVKGGRVRALGVTGTRRAPTFPELPTISEAGVPGYEVVTWSGVIVPSGVPNAIVQRLNKEMNRALAAPAVAGKLPDLGLQVVGGTPEQFRAHVRKEAARWADVVKRSGAKLE